MAISQLLYFEQIILMKFFFQILKMYVIQFVWRDKLLYLKKHQNKNKTSEIKKRRSWIQIKQSKLLKFFESLCNADIDLLLLILIYLVLIFQNFPLWYPIVTVLFQHQWKIIFIYHSNHQTFVILNIWPQVKIKRNTIFIIIQIYLHENIFFIS